ncbi:hypothetical protein SCUCBS95973_003135 [Sporothrix curviconia]|uniref:Uncharacterized protein n=1 Tax=Sporothrix curviconia TaxID=1260050 RepID=A0ABP0BD32_9PEZI
MAKTNAVPEPRLDGSVTIQQLFEMYEDNNPGEVVNLRSLSSHTAFLMLIGYILYLLYRVMRDQEALDEEEQDQEEQDQEELDQEELDQDSLYS